ncbi:MAG: glycosyltransferase [Anaerolineales bacterium]|jgi:glycosyltransferase involved in cell wall biosynthesis
MKIAVLAPTYLPAQRANTLQVMKMSQALAVLGHDVRVAVPGQRPKEVRWEDLASQYGLSRRFEIDWLSSRPGLRSYDYGLSAVLWARRWEADLIYTRHPQAAAAASLMNLPCILEIHDYPQGTVGPQLFRAFLRGRGARRLVVITQALLADLQAGFTLPDRPDFSLVLPDGVDLERFSSLPDPETARRSLVSTGALPDLPVDRYTAGYTGHLYAGRGVKLLMELARLLPEVTFLLAGGEPAHVAALHNQAAAAGLSNLVITGFIPNADLPRYQAACDVLLMPYQVHVAASSGGDIGRYLSPMKMFDYLACERPILSSNLPVLTEILDADSAVLLPPDDPSVWAAAILSLEADPPRAAKLASCARQKAASYTWTARARRMLGD